MTVHHFAALHPVRRQAVILTRGAVGGFFEARAEESRFAHAGQEGVNGAFGDAQPAHVGKLPHQVIAVDLALGDHVEHAEFEQSAADLGGPVVYVEVVLLRHGLLPRTLHLSIGYHKLAFVAR